MKYRQFYEDKTGVHIPNSYDIHHIDIDRDNNGITNLVAIPSYLHVQIHKALNELPPKYITAHFQDVSFLHYWEQLKEYELVFKKVGLCIDFRNYLYFKKNGRPLCGLGYIDLHLEYNYEKLNYDLYYMDIDYENSQV